MDGGAVAQVVGPAAEPMRQAAQQASKEVGILPTIVVLAAFAMVFTVEFVRSMPWADSARTKKPLACDACLVTWASIAVGIYFGTANGVAWSLVHTIPAAGLALLGLALRGYWKGNNLGVPPS